MRQSKKGWLKQSIKFLLIAILAIALIPFTGLKAETVKAAENESTFALTWKDGDTERSATIHYGRLDAGGNFIELGEEAVLDTSAASVSLANNFDGYTFISAYYTTTEGFDSDEAEINSILTKQTSESGGYTWEMTQLATETTDERTATVTSGSHIYALYGLPPVYPSGDDQEEEIPVPKTEKSVTDENKDGIYTIQLDLEPTAITEDNSHYANVLIVVDRTSSMAGDKWTNAKLAINTLVDTLTTGDNAANAGKIDFCLVGFGGNYSGTNDKATLVNWTKSNGDFKDYVVNDLSMVSSSRHGTNWEGGLSQAYSELTKRPDTDPTYVIFLTDGNPNCTDTTEFTGMTGMNNDLAANEARDDVRDITYYTGVEEVHLYGVFCFAGESASTSDTSYIRLNNLICGANEDPTPDQGGDKTIAATAATIQSEFATIAQTIADSLTTDSHSIDDGLPSLSSISAMTSGEASGYQYYISYKLTLNEDGTAGTYKDGNETKTVQLSDENVWTKTEGEGEEAVTTYLYRQTWAEAPGASYSEDNGVTWDLSKAGTLNTNAIYSITFEVWPSQEAFDIIANLNNGTQYYTYAQYKAANPDSTLSEEEATAQGYVITEEQRGQITEHEDGTYTIPTNTHLKTTYSFKGETYTEVPEEFPSEEMLLESEEMDVRKAFAHDINEQDPYAEIDFYLLVDGKYYLKNGSTSETFDENTVYSMRVNEGNHWTESVYISPGVMKGTQVLEPGHKYTLEEKVISGNQYEYEFTPQTIRPMEINGVLTYLVLADKYNPVPDGATTYTIDSETYFVDSSNNGELVGTNRKTAELDITKQIVDHTGNFTEAQLNAETFTYRVTLTVPKDSNISGITAYEYVPRYDDDPADNRYTIFGYQEDEDEEVQGFSDDVERFSGKIYGGYTVVPTTESGANRPQLSECFEVSGDYKTVTLDITLKRNEIIRFTNLPANTQYTITEMYNNYRQSDPSRDADALGSTEEANIADQGYTTTIETKSRNPVTGGTRVLDEPIEGTTVTGTIDYLDVRYYNLFTNTLNDVIDVELTGTKKHEGYNWTASGASERYYFNLSGEEESTPLPTIGAYGRVRFYLQATADEVGTDTLKSYSFGKIRFTEPGEYIYTIEEDKAGTTQNVNGTLVKYGGPETVKIVIAENAGKLSVQSVTNESGHTVWDAEKMVANTTIANTALTDVTAKKIWDDKENINNTRPTSVTFNLMKKVGDGAASEVMDFSLDGIADSKPTGTEPVAYESAAWEVTFMNLPTYENGEQIEYSVTEDPVDNYTTTVNGFEITNTYNFGGLEISKTVDPGNGDPSVAQKEFEFKVEFFTDDTKEETTGDTEFEYTITKADGTKPTGKIASGGTVTLKHGEKVTFEELPAGIYYVVTETSVTGFVTTVNNVAGTTAEGTIAGSETATLAFTNTYNAEPVKAQIPVTKKINPEGSSTTDITGKFTFTLTPVNGAPMPEGKTSLTVTSGKEGETVKFDEIEYTAPGTYTYNIVESFTDPDVTDVGGITLETDKERTVTVTIADDGKGALVVSTNSGATYDNPYGVKALDIKIPVTKILDLNGLTGPDDITGKFTFTLAADNESNAEGVESPMPVTKNTITNPAANGGTAEFGDKDLTGTITVTAPGEYHYTVTESLTGDAVPGVSVDSEPKAVVVTVTDNKDGTMSYEVTGDGKAITNTYNIVTPNKAEIPVKKVMTGTNAPEITDEFTFVLTPQADDAGVLAPMPTDEEGAVLESMTVQSNGSGNVVWFDEIPYTAPGTYKYKIVETDTYEPIPGVTNDASEQTVTVTVTDNKEGGLNVSVSSTEQSPVTFTNAYNEATISIPVIKVLDIPEGYTGPESIKGKFKFTLTAAEGTPMPDVTEYVNEADNGGNMTFGLITYTSAGEYTYTVTETNVGEPVPGVKNDEQAAKTITVTVTKNEETGALTAALSDVNGITFTNTYETEDAKASFPVKKVLQKQSDDADGPDQWSFDIKVEAQDGAPTVTTMTGTVTNEKDTVTFGEFTFTDPGTYTYKVTETGTVDGVTPDGEATSGKTVTVTVSDNQEGKLVAKVSSTDETPLTFTNTYTYTETETVLKVHKTLEVPEGLAGPDDITEAFTFTLTAGTATYKDKTTGTSPMPEGTGNVVKNPEKDGGTASFGTIKFVKPGTYEYQIVESDGNVAGVTNDTSKQTATVTIVDGKDGKLKVEGIVYSSGKGEAEFVNKYDVTPARVSFPAEKVLEEDKASDLTPLDITGKYTFTLADDTTDTVASPLPETTSLKNPDADGGTVTFGTDADPIEFTKPGTYKYTITETGEVANVTNDPEAAAGKTITVTVVDNKNGTLTATPSVTSDNPVVFTNTRQQVSATVVKIWEDYDDLYGKRPESLTVDLLADGVKVQTVTLTKDNKWTETVKDLPKLNAEGKEIAYTWAEGKMPAGYELTNTATEGRVTTLTNSRQYGDLVIRKDLTKYNDFVNSHEDAVTDQVTFVFHVTATKDGKEVYDDYVGLTFDGTSPIIYAEIEGMIPVGAVVTVEEEYSGAGYAVQGESTKTVTITDPTSGTAVVAEADLTNAYDDRIPGGYGIVNHYTKDDEGKWNGEKLDDPVPEPELQ